MVKVDLYFGEGEEIMRHVEFPAMPRVQEFLYVNGHQYTIWEIVWYVDGISPLLSLAR